MTEPAYLSAARAAYDTVAVDYAKLAPSGLETKPLDRAMLRVLAELVRGAGPVADLGCGPGHVTAHLHELGVPAFGIDLSEEMIAVARRDHPGLRFEVGSMTALDLPDGGLAGTVAWYSIIHTPPGEMPALFAEIHRVLAPGGHLLLAFQAGDEIRHLDHAYGHDISLDAYRLPPERVAETAEQSGFAVDARLVREPGTLEKTRQAFLLARKI
jgi:SAM-dependent methyltransferase